MNRPRKMRELEQAITEITGAQVSVNANDGDLVISGVVESEEQREAIQDLVSSLNPGAPIRNLVSVELPALDLQPEPTNVLEVYSAGPEAPRWEEEEAETVFPATDPVVGLDERGEVQVLGGFADTSLDTVEVDESTLGPGAGDWALAEAIERELREDASTTDLNVRVRVYRGVAHLSGRISGPEDAENAESVAASVPGVREVVDELEVEA